VLAIGEASPSQRYLRTRGGPFYSSRFPFERRRFWGRSPPLRACIAAPPVQSREGVPSAPCQEEDPRMVPQESPHHSNLLHVDDPYYWPLEDDFRVKCSPFCANLQHLAVPGSSPPPPALSPQVYPLPSEPICPPPGSECVQSCPTPSRHPMWWLSTAPANDASMRGTRPVVESSMPNISVAVAVSLQSAPCHFASVVATSVLRGANHNVAYDQGEQPQTFRILWTMTNPLIVLWPIQPLSRY